MIIIVRLSLVLSLVIVAMLLFARCAPMTIKLQTPEIGTNKDQDNASVNKRNSVDEGLQSKPSGS